MLVASQDACELPSSLRPAQVSTEGVPCCRKLRAIAASSSLFRACKLIQTEGLFLFYEHHHFEIEVEDDGCLRAIRRWLRNIGQTMRENIRHLKITFIEEPELAYMNSMGRIHVELSDQATVSYNANDGGRELWNIGAACERRDSRSVPIFEMGRVYGLDKRFTYIRAPSFRSVPGRPVELKCSLVFLPNKSWFGLAGPRSVY